MLVYYNRQFYAFYNTLGQFLEMNWIIISKFEDYVFYSQTKTLFKLPQNSQKRLLVNNGFAYSVVKRRLDFAGLILFKWFLHNHYAIIVFAKFDLQTNVDGKIIKMRKE